MHRYKTFHIAAVALALNTSAAFAQAVDPNLQVRIENALPQPDIRPKLPTIELVPVQRRQTVTTVETIQLTLDEQKQRLAKAAKNSKRFMPLANSPEALDRALRSFGIPKTERRVRKKTVVVTDQVPRAAARQVVVTAAAQSQTAFDTNATKSNLNRVSDWVFSNSGSLNVNVPVGKLDNIIFQAGVADQRYAKLFARDIDLLTASASYVQVIGTSAGPRGLAAPGVTTVDALSYSLASTTVFGSGFRPYQVELFTPSLTLARSNIDLGQGVCGLRGKEAYCLSGATSVAGEYTFSDIASQENFAGRLQGSATWRTSVEGLTAGASGTVQARYYTAFPGGRQDLLFQAALRADYVVSPNVTLSGVLQISQQWSTFRAAEWNGLTVFPLIRLKAVF